LVLNFSGRFLLTESQKRQRMSMYISLFTVLPFCKLYQRNPATSWSSYVFSAGLLPGLFRSFWLIEAANESRSIPYCDQFCISLIHTRSNYILCRRIVTLESPQIIQHSIFGPCHVQRNGSCVFTWPAEIDSASMSFPL